MHFNDAFGADLVEVQMAKFGQQVISQVGVVRIPGPHSKVMCYRAVMVVQL